MEIEAGSSLQLWAWRIIQTPKVSTPKGSDSFCCEGFQWLVNGSCTCVTLRAAATGCWILILLKAFMGVIKVNLPYRAARQKPWPRKAKGILLPTCRTTWALMSGRGFKGAT